jgi:hypothetical protein
MEEKEYYIKNNYLVYIVPSHLLIKGSRIHSFDGKYPLEVKYYITT